MKKHSKLNLKLDRFPLGSIHAEGHLKQQMLRGKDGICGHLHELEPEMINDPYVNKSYVAAWSGGNQAGWGAEISGNYWSGYIQFAFTLNDAEMINTATQWVDAMMKRQRADGYLGTYYEEDANIFEDYNAWGTASAMRGLIAFYEATGRRDVLDAVHRCMLWFCDNWAGDKKTCYGGQFIIEPMIFTYYYTGDMRLVSFAEEYIEYLCKNDIFENSYLSMLNGEFHYNSNHTAGLGANLRLPALVYSATGRKELLDASERRIHQVMEKSVQLSGGPVSVSEYLGPVGAVAETEYCCFTFFNATYSYMSCITGDPKYGEYMEQMFYNGAQGARKKDEKAIAYMSAPNQIYATENSSPAFHDMQVYAPCYPTSCCPVNAVAVIPEFVRGMLLHDDDGGIYVTAYGPCSLRHEDVALSVETYYPFRNRAEIVMECSKNFALNLRIPSWCEKYTVKVNGTKTEAPNNGGYARICSENAWRSGDRVEIEFETKVRVIRVDDSDGAGKHPIAISYGALLFSYHIPEKWEPIAGKPMTKLPQGWSWYNVNPDFADADVADPYERIGLRRHMTTWNVALDENLSAEDITVEELPCDGYVWENPMIKLHTYCRKAPYLCAPYPIRTFEPYGEYQHVTERIPLTLEPYGCTNLRISYFPKYRGEKQK